MKIVYSLALFRANASGYESERAGTSRGIFFSNFVASVLRAYRVVFRDWELRIHHDERIKDRECWPLIDRCARAGLLKLYPMGEAKTLCDSMLWRTEPLKDTSVDWVVCRDVDSLPMHRDRKMIEQAIGMGAEAHAILDSESHSGPLMGGMTAFSKATWGHFFNSKRDGIDMDQHGADQRYLNREIWPHVKSKTVIHQRRRDILYHDAMKTLPVAPKETVLDGIVNHIGAGYDLEKAMIALRDHHPDEVLDWLEAGRWPDREYSAWDEPWYVREAINFLGNYITPTMKVLEYGGAGSTVWYSKRAASVLTVERNPLWRTLIQEQHLPNVNLVPIGPDNGEFDIIAVDDDRRMDRLAEGRAMLKPGGLMVLDNSNEHPQANELFSGWDKVQASNGKWETTIWRKP